MGTIEATRRNARAVLPLLLAVLLALVHDGLGRPAGPAVTQKQTYTFGEGGAIQVHRSRSLRGAKRVADDVVGRARQRLAAQAKAQAKKKAGAPAKAAGAGAAPGGLPAEVLFNRVGADFHRLGIAAAPGEHPCFAGFASAVAPGGVCKGFRRQYPAVGGRRTFRSLIDGSPVEATLRQALPLVNIWGEDGTVTADHVRMTRQAVDAATNPMHKPALMPAVPGDSWLEGLCKTFGPMPFHFSCSNRINIVVFKCGFDNAFAGSDYLYNFPDPVDAKSPQWADISFFMCIELLDLPDSSPENNGQTVIHELTHTVQLSFGFSPYTALIEGHATFHEGTAILGTRHRPLTVGTGPVDWNVVLAGHIYTLEGVNRKFYQTHNGLLSQSRLRYGMAVAERVMQYQSYSSLIVGRQNWEFFLANPTRHPNLQPTSMDPSSPSLFLNIVAMFRISLTASCVTDPAKLPEIYRVYPAVYWYCTTLPTIWAHERANTGGRVTARARYGGSAVSVLRSPVNPQITVASIDAGARVAVVAERADGTVAVRYPVKAGETVTLPGAHRQVQVVTVNTDPLGEFVCSGERAPWKWTQCPQHAEAAKCWSTDGYQDLTSIALQSPKLEIPAGGASLSFDVFVDTEPLYDGATFAGCGNAHGWDGAQVRAITSDGTPVVLFPTATSDAHYTTPVAAISASLGTNSTCGLARGWSGSQPWRRATFSLARFAKQRVQFQFAFFADSASNAYGVAAKRFVVEDVSGNVLYRDSAGPTAPSTLRPVFVLPPPALTDPLSGVPIVTTLPSGCMPDASLLKVSHTLGSVWSAQWQQPPAGRREAYIGYPFLDIDTTAQALVKPMFEVLVPFTAPFAGSLAYADVSTTGYRVNVVALTVTIRQAQAPYSAVATAATDSLSSGPSDAFLEGIQRIFFSKGQRPTLKANQEYFLAIGAIPKPGVPATEPQWVGLPLGGVGPRTATFNTRTKTLVKDAFPQTATITGLFQSE